MDEEMLMFHNPADFRPIPLEEAPSGWPRWQDTDRAPPDLVGRALAMIRELEAGQIPVAKPEDIPWAARQEAHRYDRRFAPEARPFGATDLKMSWQRHPERDEYSTVGRTWSVELDGGRVVISVCEKKLHMAVRLRPEEWAGRNIDERLAWVRWALPRLVRIRGGDSPGKVRADVDLRFRRIDERHAHLMTPTWSDYPQKWFTAVAGAIGDDGVALLIYRRDGNEQGY